MKATYRPWKDENVIKDLYLKGVDVNMAGNCIDACASRKALTEAKVIEDDSDKLTAELKWGGHTTSHITMYRDSPVMKIDQKSGNAPNIVDASAGLKNIVCHGSDQWKREINTYPKCYYYINDKHCAEQNGDQGSSDGDPGALLYNDWFVMGVHNNDGVGYGRVMAKTVKIIKFLDWGGRGFEYFWNNHVGYLYVTDKGGDEILKMGRKIADWANAGEQGLPLGDTHVSNSIYRKTLVTVLPVSIGRRNAHTIEIIMETAEWLAIDIFSMNGARLFSACGSAKKAYTVPAHRLPNGACIVAVQSRGASCRKAFVMTR
jgi:hypothetical protein